MRVIPLDEDWEIKTWNDGEPYATKKTPPALRDGRGKVPVKACEVTFIASEKYNGGIVVLLDGVEHWVKGFRIPRPVTPEGFELVGMGVGHQLNCTPPFATEYLKKQ